jgi:predicted membrane channel-forming protein YqfA (hemolysin III family)
MSKSNTNSGLSFPILLFLLFLGLKLAEVGVVANWSWWWVTSPLWIPVSLVFGTAILAIVIIIIALIFGMSFNDIRIKAENYNRSRKIKK